MIIFFRSISLLISLMVLTGCGTTYHVIPEVANVEVVDFSIIGQIAYDGNPDYLPQTVKQGVNNTKLPLIKYTYHAGYGKDSIPDVIPLFNPLSLVGCPIGSDSLVIIGVLEISKEGKTLKQYSATCVFDKNRNLFYEGKTFSELRKIGLLMVRKNIESQMLNDRKLLLRLLQ